jgi:hypothetical protein
MQAPLPSAGEATAPGAIERATAIATVLVTNAIPLYGVLRLGWSVANVLVMYWLENLLVAVFTCLRIATHRWLTHKRGHQRAGQLGSSSNGKPSKAGLLGEYATVAFVFTLAHGVFVAAIALLFAGKHPDDPLWRFSWPAFHQAALMLSLVLAAGFAADLPGMRSRSFAWIKAQVQQRMGRVLVLHLAIIVGMATMAATDSPLGLLYVLIGLKTLWDVALTRVVAAPVPKQPPRWLLALGDRLGKDKGGAAAMAEQWSSGIEAARRQAIEDEQVMRT